MIIIYAYPFHQVYRVSSNELLQASINWKGEARLHFAYNTITKIVGDESIYKIISTEQENYGSTIRISYNPYFGQNFKISFIDDNNKVIDINFVAGFLGNDFMLIIDHDSPYYGKKIKYNPPINTPLLILLSPFR